MKTETRTKRYIVGISGASGPVIGLRLVEELLKEKDTEVHLVLSAQAVGIIELETTNPPLRLRGKTKGQMEKALAGHFGSSRGLVLHQEGDMEAPIASGSFRTEGMFVVPCSMKSLSAIANGYASTLIERAADVMIKEGRLLVLAPREMPLSPIHLENMLKLSRLGVVIAPPVAAFYPRPETLEQLIDFFVGKLLDSAGLERREGLFRRWEGLPAPPAPRRKNK